MTRALLSEHGQYVHDRSRIAAYRKALARVIRPGARVLDLGAGSGVLGCLACEAGAGHVYAVDDSAMIEIARETARASGYGERMTFYRAPSTEVALPEKVDVVVADQMAPFAVGAGLLESFHDARARLLREGGVLVPSSVGLWVAAVEAPETRADIDAWGQSPAGLELTHVRALAVDTAYWLRLHASQLLGAPSRLASLELGAATAASFAASADLTIDRPGTLDGIGGWFSASLAEGISITSSPLAEDRIERENIFFPLERPVAVEAGNRVALTTRITPTEPTFSWTVEVSGASGPVARCTGSTLRGLILSREDLARSRPDHVPQLSPRGEAQRTVLGLIDGRHTLAQIEAEVLRAHGALFPTREAAAGFIARVLAATTRMQ